ncbi:N-acetylneuraminate synthase family protein [Methanocalculus sp. MC3]
MKKYMTPINICGQLVGDGFPTYIIAEVGINHNGDVSLAKDMVRAAWESGADAVKIQTFITRDFLHPSHPGYQYDIDAEISHEDEQEIWEFARKNGINLFSTPEDYKSLQFIQKQNPCLIKIAAMDFNYQEMVQNASKLLKPILLSTGMSTMEEVLQTVRWVEETGNKDYIILHCVSCYPTSPGSCNLKAIQTMKQVLDCPVGFSDHTQGIHIPLAAVAMGANVIEKHFTNDKKLPGPDQHCSIDSTDLKQLISHIRDLELAIGSGKKVPAPEEDEPRQYKRRGVYAIKDLDSGTMLRRKDVTFFAPSKPGSTVTDWRLMEHRILKNKVREMEPIYLSDLN